MPDEPQAIVHIEPPPSPQSRAAPFEMRPLVQVRRIALIEREVRERLSQAALDAVFACAEILSEGEASVAGSQPIFVGSTMLTVDIVDLADILREPADEDTARRLGGLLAKEPSLDARSQGIVRREVERLSQIKPKSVRGETRIRVRGTRIYLDIDVEAVLS